MVARLLAWLLVADGWSAALATSLRSVPPRQLHPKDPVKLLGLDLDMKTIVMWEVGVERKPAACTDITCGALDCPAPFKPTDVGGCCPVCVSDEVGGGGYGGDGASGKYGGQPSKVGGNCAGAWCFPLMCPAGEVPGQETGNCCPTCVSR
mmetsp:Transcript_62971/g.99520  ORF Transcript_62971/g.99520 Transcript_62971/m.99520 type:complete len:150 (+) Transcript_62971:55-504(+)